MMSELQPDPNKPKQLKTRPGAQSSDVAALGNLLDLMNNAEITGAEIPAGADPKEALRAKPIPSQASPEFSDPLASLANHVDLPEPAPAPPTPIAAAPTAPANRLFFTGRLKAGKDFVANAAGLKQYGFADALYSIATYFFGKTINASVGKDLPGARAFLQAAGQYGRGQIDEKYPLTPARAVFVDAVRKLGVAGEFGDEFGVDWSAYGRDENLWLNATLLRIELHMHSLPDARIGITNCRFPNEFSVLKDAGFQHWHVMASPKTWAERLAKSKLTPESPQVKDVSERLAANFDAGVVKQLSAQKSGPMLRVVWADENVPPPWPRVHTVQSFLKHVGVAAQQTATIINDEF